MPETADPIKHIVVLILENHSFDQMLGCFKDIIPDLDGIDKNNLRINRDDKGKAFAQAETRERQMLLDPHHEVEHVATQLADNNNGFVLDFAKSFPESDDQARQFIMGYYPLGFLPALHALGHEFTICDRWFSSLPGPTWPNRFFALTGTSLGRVNMPDDGTNKADVPGYFQQDQDTIFDRLTEKGIHWKSYFHDVPQSWVLKHQRMPHNAARYFYIDEFFDDARGAEAEFPQFSFIEPDFMGVIENDDHPPHDIMKAEKLISDVYNALRGNADLWQSTLLVVFYDEHGGFYDHVVPPAASPPDDHHEEYTFDRLGMRVPALLISPWVDHRVEHARFDHTSLLKYLTDKWGLAPLPSRRITQAESIKIAIARTTPRQDTLVKIVMTPDELKVPDLAREDAACDLVSAHHLALQHLARYLPTALWEETKTEAWAHIPRVLAPLARAFEWVKAQLSYMLEALKYIIDGLLAGLYQHGGLTTTIAEPDKIAVKFAEERDLAAKFLIHQKPRSIRGLAKRIQDETRAMPERQYALRTLASITGRQFHLHNIEHARNWLQRHGRE